MSWRIQDGPKLFAIVEGRILHTAKITGYGTFFLTRNKMRMSLKKPNILIKYQILSKNNVCYLMNVDNVFFW